MSNTGKLFLLLALGLLGLSVYVHFTVWLWGDQEWELLVARNLLTGKKLYIDQFPVNPPLIFWLYTLPAAFSFYTGLLKDFHALALGCLCAIALTIALSCRMIASHPAFSNDKAKQIQFAILLAFLFVFRIATPYFGDREHLFLALTFPYLLRWMPSLSGVPFSQRVKILIGCLAGIGFFIKPHCLILFAGIQLVCFLRKSRPAILGSLENYIIYSTGLAYVVAIFVFTPDYITTVMPMAMLTYSAISAGPSTLFDYTIAITLACTFAFFRLRAQSPYRNDIYYFLGLSLFLLAYGMSNSGWGYTFQPIITLLLFTNGFVLWEFLYLRKENAAHGLPAWRYACGAGGCLFNFVSKALVVLIYFHTAFNYDCTVDSKCHGFYDTFIDELKAEPHPHSFGTIGMDFALWTRVSKLSGAEWVTRFAQMWMIPKFIIADTEFTSAHRWILYYVTGALAEDLERNKPDLVFVDKSDTIYMIRLQKPLNWIAAFSVYENFKEAWRHYAYAHTINKCDTPEPALAVGRAMMNRPAPETESNCMYDVYKRMY